MARSGRFRFPKSHRLRRRREFLFVQRYGKRRRGPALVVVATTRDDELIRIGITVSRKVGNAVVRNRIKRQIREVFRLYRSQLPTSHDVVVIARREARDATFEALRDEMIGSIRALGRRRDARRG